MFLSKHSNGRYYIYYFTPAGIRKSISTKTKSKKEAFDFLTDFREKLKLKENQKIIPIDLKEFRNNYFKYAESIHTTKTVIGYKTVFNSLINYFGNVQLTEITKQKIEAYLLYRLNKGSIYVARRDHATLSSIFNKAIQDDYLLINPCMGIKRFRPPEKQPLFYSKEDFEKLLSCIDREDIRDLVIFAVNTGLRQMELISLEWTQVDFKNNFIILDNHAYITKSKKIRTLPLNESALNILIKRKNNSNTQNVFTLNGNPIDQNYIAHKFKKYIYAASLNPKLNFHSLRHSFASWLIQKGASIYHVSKLLGHSDIKTTEIYSHLRSEDLKNSINLLDI